jgi:tetratricopeptide (TPR) repeat protein
MLLILDCCYSGAAVSRNLSPLYYQKGNMDLDKYLEEITKSKAIQLLAAGTENQPVSDSGLRVGNSAFTGAPLDILESESELEVDGILTADEVGLKLRTEVMRHYRQSDQTPVFHHLMGSKAGDFVLRISKKLHATVDNKLQQHDEKGTSMVGNNNTVDTGQLISTVYRHLEQREYEEALRLLDEALKANPRAPYIWFLKGNVLSLKRDYGEAVACYDRVLELTPDDQLAQKYRKQAMRNLDKARNPKKKTAKRSGEVKKLPGPRQKSAEVSTKLSDEIDQKIRESEEDLAIHCADKPTLPKGWERKYKPSYSTEHTSSDPRYTKPTLPAGWNEDSYDGSYVGDEYET